MASGADTADLGYRPVRIYTLAMRFPRMVGKGFNGERLPGGPYTVPQFVGGGMTFGLSGISAYYCPLGNPLLNLLIGAGLTFLIGGALANIPVDGIRITTRLMWIAGLLVSTSPTTSEMMPTGSPIAIVGGEVAVLDEPQRDPRPLRRPRRRTPDAAPPPRPPLLASTAPVRAAAPPTPTSAPPIAPGRASAPAAAAVFGALTGTR